jgi:adenine-specific DNA-methyltransferase
MNIKTIRYSGSKKKILQKINDITESLDIKNVLDGFSGSARVSANFKDKGLCVTANDMAIYSKVLNDTFLLAGNNRKELNDKIDYLNSMKPTDGWYTENYGGEYNNGLSVQSDGLKKPFYIDVTRKLDSVRDEIDKLYPNDCVDKSVLLTSLLVALDGRCNDLGHHVSYLRKWSKKSLGQLFLELPKWYVDDLDHKVYNKNVFDIEDSFDLVYFDPPYGTANQRTKTSRVRYYSYYHLWTTIVKNDKPKLFGVSKRREDVSSDSKKGAISEFEHLKDDVVLDSFKRLLNFNTKYTLISYSNRSKIGISKLIELVGDTQQLIDVMSFTHQENSQARSLINSKYKTEYKDKNLEYLILSKK